MSFADINDYFWSQGPTGADIPASSITGYWYVTGTVRSLPWPVRV